MPMPFRFIPERLLWIGWHIILHLQRIAILKLLLNTPPMGGPWSPARKRYNVQNSEWTGILATSIVGLFLYDCMKLLPGILVSIWYSPTAGVSILMSLDSCLIVHWSTARDIGKRQEAYCLGCTTTAGDDNQMITISSYLMQTATENWSVTLESPFPSRHWRYGQEWSVLSLCDETCRSRWPLGMDGA